MYTLIFLIYSFRFISSWNWNYKILELHKGFIIILYVGRVLRSLLSHDSRIYFLLQHDNFNFTLKLVLG